MSGHELECERLCFERWFYLEAFLEREKINEFCFLDSDFFLFMDLEELRPAWAGFEMAGAPAYAFGWYGNREVVRRFCDFMLEKFRDGEQIARWKEVFGGGRDLLPPDRILNVSDMLLWMMYIRNGHVSHLDLRIPRNGIVFDNWFEDGNGFRMRGGFKELKSQGGVFSGFYERTGESVRFAGLHMGGKYGKRLGPFFTGWPLPLIRACCRSVYRRNLRRLLLIAAHYLTKPRPYLKANAA